MSPRSSSDRWEGIKVSNFTLKSTSVENGGLEMPHHVENTQNASEAPLIHWLFTEAPLIHWLSLNPTTLVSKDLYFLGCGLGRGLPGAE